MFVLMTSGSSWKLGHVGQKLGYLAKSAENLVNSSGHIFEAIIMNLAQNLCLDDFYVKFETGSLWIKN